MTRILLALTALYCLKPFPTGALQGEMVLVHYETDVCGYDDIGLKRLTTKDIETKL